MCADANDFFFRVSYGTCGLCLFMIDNDHLRSRIMYVIDLSFGTCDAAHKTLQTYKNVICLEIHVLLFRLMVSVHEGAFNLFN